MINGKLTNRKIAHPVIEGETFVVLSSRHVRAASRISSVTALHQFIVGTRDKFLAKKTSFALMLLSEEGNNSLLEAIMKKILMHMSSSSILESNSMSAS